MPENKKLKLKQRHTVCVRPDSQIANILRVMSVSGEIAAYSFKLFGVGGENEDYVQYSRVKRLLLSNVIYKDVNKKVLYDNEDETNVKKAALFSVRSCGQTKTIRVKAKSRCLFVPLGLGERFDELFKDRNLAGDPPTIKRNIKLSDWCIFCHRAGIQFNPMFTPKVYNLGSATEDSYGPKENGPREVKERIFYPSREIRRRDEKAKKYGNGSRVVGVFVSPDGIELCHWIPPHRATWTLSEELSFEGYLKNYFGPHNFGFPFDPTLKYDLLCIAESYELSEQVIFKPSFEKGDNLKKIKLTDSTVFKDLYRDIYVFPRNENGIRQFKFHTIPNLKETLLDFYIRNPQAVADASSCTFQCDAYDKAKNIATVFFYDGCVTKLQSCVVGKSTDYARGENAVKLRIYCFPWQTQYIKDKFAGIKGVTIIDDDYEKVYGIISRRAQKGDGAK